MIFKFFKNLFSKQKRIEQKIKDTLYKDNKQCHYCGVKLYREECTLDHVVPKSKGGPTSIENSVLCCTKCNQLKGNSNYEDFKVIVNTVEKRDYYWKRYEKRINDNIIIDIVYPYLSEKTKEYRDRLKIIRNHKSQLLKIYGKDHKRVKDLDTKRYNIEQELYRLRIKTRNYKKQIKDISNVHEGS